MVATEAPNAARITANRDISRKLLPALVNDALDIVFRMSAIETRTIERNQTTVYAEQLDS
jgi:hypothetical protein